MDKKKTQLIKKAQRIYGEIFPCMNHSTLEDCFTLSKRGDPILWFNTKDESTHMVTIDNVKVYDVLTMDKIKQQKNYKNQKKERE